ncbi:hypothetical protein [Microbacterium sp. 77mftsu3.1]|uniref:hypothetical protein n=1 Tax=Microbacterium sp. 77mftsu3.1 TaxID=1761802 RepID=UPI00039EFCD9|nr:hypothetical protein [Microbacterium sp. 77mftsu3.1]SDH34705.1 CobQ/CobB/MinD/ParA nucleotide binding domain-containing protein [Microbacterium sp. 77mftsu3.1]
MSATPSPTVGVVGAPDVAAALREIGYTVITGDTFRATAIAIANALKQSKFHVVVETMTEPGLSPWVAVQHTKSLGVILLPTDPSVIGPQIQSVPQLALPAKVNDLLVMMGDAPAMADAGERVIAAGISTAQAPVAPAPQPAPVVSADPFESLIAQASGSGVPAPASPVAPIAPVVSDPFDVAAPAAVTDPFEAPAVSDPFDAVAAPDPLAVVADVTDPFDGRDDFTSMLAQATLPDATPGVEVAADAPQLGAPNPVAERAEAPVFDPFAAESITGADEGAPAGDPDVLAAFLGGAAELPLLAVEPAPEQVTEAAPVEVTAEDPAAPEATDDIFELARGLVATEKPKSFAGLLRRRRQVAEQPETTEPAAADVPEPEEPPAPAAAPVTVPEVISMAPAAVDALDVADLMFSVPAAEAAPATPPRELFFCAATGGAGTTTLALLTAQTAAVAGLRVLLIDANSQQGDIASALRVSRAGFPAVGKAEVGNLIVSAAQLNAARPASAPDVAFDVILAPARGEVAVAASSAYRAAIADARQAYDLIVVDSPVLVGSGEFERELILPAVTDGAWAAGLVVHDYSAIAATRSTFAALNARGLPAERTVMLGSRWPARDRNAEQFTAMFGAYGMHAGFAFDDPNVSAQKSAGNLLVGSRALAPALAALLRQVTGKDVFTAGGEV